MNPKTLSLVLYATFSLLSQNVQASAESSPGGLGSSGKRTILDVNNADDAEGANSSKSQALMTPTTEGLILAATDRLGIHEGLINKEASSDSDEFDDNFEDFLENYYKKAPKVMPSKVEPSIINPPPVPEPPKRRLVIRRNAVAVTAGPGDSSAVQVQAKEPAQIPEATVIHSVQAQANPEEAGPFFEPPTEIERQIWADIYNHQLKNARNKIISSGYKPKLTKYVYDKMSEIMRNDRTVIETLNFLNSQFPDIFRKKFLNGDYVYKEATSKNVNALLSANPESINIRIAVLDSIIQNKKTKIILGSDFFAPLSGDENRKMRHNFFTLRRDFMNIDYRQLLFEDNRVKWRKLMKELLQMFPEDATIRIAYMKLCVHSNLSIFEDYLQCKTDPELIEMIEYVRTLPICEIQTRAVRDLYTSTASKLRELILPSGETPFTQAIIDRRTDIIDIIMSRDKEEVKQFLIARNSAGISALQFAFDNDTPEQYRDSARDIPYHVVKNPKQFVIYKKLLGLIPRYCNTEGKNSLGGIADMYFQNTYGNKTMMRLLLLELRKNRAYESDFRNTVSDILNALELPVGSFSRKN